jgi:hypothetical protein
MNLLEELPCISVANYFYQQESQVSKRKRISSKQDFNLYGFVTSISPMINFKGPKKPLSGSPSNSFFLIEFSSTLGDGPSLTTVILFHTESSLKFYPFLKMHNQLLITHLHNYVMFRSKFKVSKTGNFKFLNKLRKE